MKKVEIIIETPEGRRLGSKVEFYDNVLVAANRLGKSLDAGYGVLLSVKEGFATYIPNALARRSVIKFRDTTNDKNVPF